MRQVIEETIYYGRRLTHLDKFELQCAVVHLLEKLNAEKNIKKTSKANDEIQPKDSAPGSIRRDAAGQDPCDCSSL